MCLSLDQSLWLGLRSRDGEEQSVKQKEVGREAVFYQSDLSFIMKRERNLVNNYFSDCYVPGTVLSPGDTSGNKKEERKKERKKMSFSYCLPFGE